MAKLKMIYIYLSFFADNLLSNELLNAVTKSLSKLNSRTLLVWFVNESFWLFLWSESINSLKRHTQKNTITSVNKGELKQIFSG